MRMTQQRGMTFIGAVFTLGTVAYVLYSIVVMIFIHMEHLKIGSAMESLKVIPRVTQQSEEIIRGKLRSNLINNNIYDEDLDRYSKSFKIVFDNNELKINIKYSISIKLLLGFSLTKKYEDKISIVSN